MSSTHTRLPVLPARRTVQTHRPDHRLIPRQTLRTFHQLLIASVLLSTLNLSITLWNYLR